MTPDAPDRDEIRALIEQPPGRSQRTPQVTPRARACRHLMDQGPRRRRRRADEVISEERFERYHRFAREHGANRRSTTSRG